MGYKIKLSVVFGQYSDDGFRILCHFQTTPNAASIFTRSENGTILAETHGCS